MLNRFKDVWWVRNDYCGLFSANLTVLLILYAQYVIVFVLLLPWYGFCHHVVFYTMCSGLALVSHTRAQYSNPGTVPRGLPVPVPSAPGMVPRRCKTCDQPKPSCAHHCSTCERCVLRMDHHCPWVNNCVAIFNQKYFVLFLFYTACCCIYSGALLVARFTSCTHHIKRCNLGPAQAVMCVINFIEALVFGLFVIIMLFDQISAIVESPDYIAADSKQRSTYTALKEVFGEPLHPRWLLPVKMPQRVYDTFDSDCRTVQFLRSRTYVPASVAAEDGSVGLGLDEDDEDRDLTAEAEDETFYNNPDSEVDVSKGLDTGTTRRQPHSSA